MVDLPTSMGICKTFNVVDIYLYLPETALEHPNCNSRSNFSEVEVTDGVTY